jgi:ribosome-associated translation inhibitor RaiA/cold shock CspA family protein
MQEPLEIVFRQLEPSEALEAVIRERGEKLFQLYDRLTHCRVTIEKQQRRTGNLFDVRIAMLVPGGELLVTNEPQRAKERFAGADAYEAVRSAFKVAERQLVEHKRQIRGEVKPGDDLLRGQVADIDQAQEIGFILTRTGSRLYFHRNSVLDGSYDRLERGQLVHYVEALGDTGPTAAQVWRAAES